MPLFRDTRALLQRDRRLAKPVPESRREAFEESGVLPSPKSFHKRMYKIPTKAMVLVSRAIPYQEEGDPWLPEGETPAPASAAREGYVLLAAQVTVDTGKAGRERVTYEHWDSAVVAELKDHPRLTNELAAGRALVWRPQRGDVVLFEFSPREPSKCAPTLEFGAIMQFAGANDARTRGCVVPGHLFTLYHWRVGRTQSVETRRVVPAYLPAGQLLLARVRGGEDDLVLVPARLVSAFDGR
jgi:hypothetical protein